MIIDILYEAKRTVRHSLYLFNAMLTLHEKRKDKTELTCNYVQKMFCIPIHYGRSIFFLLFEQ